MIKPVVMECEMKYSGWKNNNNKQLKIYRCWLRVRPTGTVLRCVYVLSGTFWGRYCFFDGFLRGCTGNWVKICPQNNPIVQFDTALTQSTHNRKIANNRRQILRWKVSTGRIPKLICLLFAGINVAAVVVPLVLLVLLAVLLAAGFFYYKRQVDHFDTKYVSRKTSWRSGKVLIVGIKGKN